MAHDHVIRRAEFNDKVCFYWLLSGAVVMALSIIGLPLLLIWFPLGGILTKKYLDSMECILTSNKLIMRKGIFTRIEKTIPLDKITDMGMVQGPIMRALDLQQLTVETAGQSGPGALLSLTGIKDPEDFRAAVLAQKESTAEVSAPLAASAPPASSAPQSTQTLADAALLVEIRDTLQRIEQHLAK